MHSVVMRTVSCDIATAIIGIRCDMKLTTEPIQVEGRSHCLRRGQGGFTHTRTVLLKGLLGRCMEMRLREASACTALRS